MVVKEITNKQKGYSVTLEQHEHLYVIKYKDKDLGDIVVPPLTNLSIAIDIFNKLVEKQDRVNYN